MTREEIEFNRYLDIKAYSPYVDEDDEPPAYQAGPAVKSEANDDWEPHSLPLSATPELPLQDGEVENSASTFEAVDLIASVVPGLSSNKLVDETPFAPQVRAQTPPLFICDDFLPVSAVSSLGSFVSHPGWEEVDRYTFC